MLLDDLNKLAQLGAEKPLFLWKEANATTCTKLSKNIESVIKKIEKDTETKKKLIQLKSLLDSDDINEFLLADILVYITKAFSHGDMSDGSNLKTSRYIQNAKKFYSRAKKTEFHRIARQKKVAQLTETDIQKIDKRLFENEGMLYVLEYFLALYKKIIDAPTADEKLALICSENVNLGFGDVPGLLPDIEQDEILDKFVYNILEDDMRLPLITAYYEMRPLVIKGVEHRDVELIVKSFRDFLNTLLKIYQECGVEKLSSFFFTPYGKQPLITEINL